MPSSRKAVCNWSGSPKTKLKPPSMSGLPAWSGGVLHRTEFVRGDPRWLFNFRKWRLFASATLAEANKIKELAGAEIRCGCPAQGAMRTFRATDSTGSSRSHGMRTRAPHVRDHPVRPQRLPSGTTLDPTVCVPAGDTTLLRSCGETFHSRPSSVMTVTVFLL